MTTLNTNYFSEENKRLARLINDLGELLSREDFKAYEEIILTPLCLEKLSYVCIEKKEKKLSEQEDKEFLLMLYNLMIDKFREIDFKCTN